MAARKKPKKDYCSECGAELRLRPASCPLCGAEVMDKSWSAAPTSAEDYQSNVRDLREQLRKLRNDDGAEAV